MCSDCYSRVMSSIDERAVPAAGIRSRRPLPARTARAARAVSLPSPLASSRRLP
jgi:hypothetical protein